MSKIWDKCVKKHDTYNLAEMVELLEHIVNQAGKGLGIEIQATPRCDRMPIIHDGAFHPLVGSFGPNATTDTFYIQAKAKALTLNGKEYPAGEGIFISIVQCYSLDDDFSMDNIKTITDIWYWIVGHWTTDKDWCHYVGENAGKEEEIAIAQYRKEFERCC